MSSAKRNEQIEENQSEPSISEESERKPESSVETLPLTPPSLHESYQFIKEIGHGSQAKVFLARRNKDFQLVSIKQLNIGSVKNWKEYELFQREAQVLKSIHVDGVAKFYDAIDCLDDVPPCSYIVQEYIEGSSLAELLKSGKRLKVSDVYEIIIQLLNLLNQLHRMDPPVIHRDIKPSNIMITPQKNGSFKVTLIDFGAVANPQVQSGGSTVAGTYGYMPPEQLMGNPGPASDIYALAAVAVELFTGKSPANLPTKDFRIIFEPDMEQMPPKLLNTLRKMLEPNVKDRLCDITLLIQNFTQFKNKNFKDLEKDKNSSQYSKDYNQRLKSVESVGEGGNMDLWQELRDDTPRVIPAPILTYFNDNCTPKKNVQSRSSAKTRNAPSCLSGFMTFIVLFGLIILISFSAIDPAAFVIGIPCLIFLCYTILYTRKNMNNAVLDNDFWMAEKKLHIDLESLYKLLIDGRKTIATITSIEYVPIEKSKAKYLPHNNICLCSAHPCFKITYKFNPPDDAREEDLIHEYITHVDPQNYCKEGDPLPIIYCICKDIIEKEEVVRSMPFPFPIEDTNPNELIFQSAVKTEG